jgi:putative transcriptional regulator
MSEILDMAHEMARDLHEVGAMDTLTMRKMDVLCLPPRRTFSATDVQRMIGRSLRARTLSAQKVEARIACTVINIMTSLGMPVSRKVA